MTIALIPFLGLIGLAIFCLAVFYLMLIQGSYKCSNCHSLMKENRTITLFPQAKDVIEDFIYPEVQLKIHRCTGCKKEFYTMITPNTAKNVLKFMLGEAPSQFVHVEEKELIETFTKVLNTSDLKDNLNIIKYFTDNIEIGLNTIDLKMAITKGSYQQIIKEVNQFVQLRNN